MIEGEDQAVRVARLRKFLNDRPDTTPAILEAMTSPGMKELAALAKWMRERGEIVIKPNGAMAFRDGGPIYAGRSVNVADNQEEQQRTNIVSKTAEEDANTSPIVENVTTAPPRAPARTFRFLGEPYKEGGHTLVKYEHNGEEKILPIDQLYEDVRNFPDQFPPQAEGFIEDAWFSVKFGPIAEAKSIYRFQKIRRERGEEAAIAAKRAEEATRVEVYENKKEEQRRSDDELLQTGEWKDIVMEALSEDVAGVPELKEIGIYSITGANLSNDHSTKTPLLHLFVPGDSQMGKSWFFRHCGKTLLPPTEFLSFTTISAKGLDYLADEMKDPYFYRGKVLFVDETADLSPEARARLKVIMSGGQDEISNLTVDEKKKSKLQSFKGMPIVWSCSAEAFDDAEHQFLNRPLILSVDESEEQTLNIQSMQRDQEAYGSFYITDSRKEHALRLMSRIREEKNAEVLVLFSDYYKPDDEKSRGMIPQFGSLVKAIAFANRFARPTVTASDGHPIIFATFEDGVEATRLWGKFIKEKSTHLAPRFIEVLESLNELPKRVGQTELDINDVNDKGKTAEDLTFELNVKNGKGWSLRYVKNMLSTLSNEGLAEYHECLDGKNRWVALKYPSQASHFVTFDNVTDGGEKLAKRILELKRRSSHRHKKIDKELPEDLFEQILPTSKIPTPTSEDNKAGPKVSAQERKY